MERAVMSYTVKPEQLDLHLELIDAVYAELSDLDPPAFSWATYRVKGTFRFVELASAPALPGPLPKLMSFLRYRTGLEDRCEERSFEEVDRVGSFGFGRDG